MVDITFHQPTLQALDSIQGDMLVLSFFSDERPMRGLTGMVDWRLNGRISNLVKAGRMSGSHRETLLFPCARRLEFKRIILVGLGNSQRFNRGKFQDSCNYILTTLLKLRVESFCMSLPGSHWLKLNGHEQLEIWLKEFRLSYLSPRGRQLSPSLFLVARPTDHMRMRELVGGFLGKFKGWGGQRMTEPQRFK